MLCSSFMCSSKVTVLLSNLSRSRPEEQQKHTLDMVRIDKEKGKKEDSFWFS